MSEPTSPFQPIDLEFAQLLERNAQTCDRIMHKLRDIASELEILADAIEANSANLMLKYYQNQEPVAYRNSEDGEDERRG